MRTLIAAAALVALTPACLLSESGGDPGETATPASLTTVEGLPEGAACPAGGLAIHTGRDADGDGRLSASEAETTDYVCHGADGRDGHDGLDGESGADGQDGLDGRTSLVEVRAIEADPAGACFFGGTQIVSGVDEDEDGQLSPDEVAHASTVCAVQSNEHATLTDVRVEPAGARCEHGGIVIEAGLDRDGNGALSAPEVDSSGVVCNTIEVIDGLNALVETRPASGAQCAAGGYVLRSGLDDDRDGALDATEVSQTRVLCHGADGASGLIETSPFIGGACGEDVHGWAIEAGLDDNGDGVLDPAEVDHRAEVCDGADGFLGYDGLDSLIRTGPDSAGVCPYGGFVFEAGLDADRDGVLSSLEVSTIEYVCDGHDGYDSLVEVVVDPIECPTTGIRFDAGLDLDADGFLDALEVTQSTAVCDP